MPLDTIVSVYNAVHTFTWKYKSVMEPSRRSFLVGTATHEFFHDADLVCNRVSLWVNLGFLIR